MVTAPVGRVSVALPVGDLPPQHVADLFCPPRVILRQEERWAGKRGGSVWELQSAGLP